MELEKRRNFGLEPLNSETDAVGDFRQRISTLVGDEEPFAWAKRAGIPSSTFDRIWNHGTVPKANHLLRIANRFGVSVDWLLTGKAAHEPAYERFLDALELLGPELDAIAKRIKIKGDRLRAIRDRSVKANQKEIDALVHAGNFSTAWISAGIGSPIKGSRKRVQADSSLRSDDFTPFKHRDMPSRSIEDPGMVAEITDRLEDIYAQAGITISAGTLALKALEIARDVAGLTATSEGVEAAVAMALLLEQRGLQ